MAESQSKEPAPLKVQRWKCPICGALQDSEEEAWAHLKHCSKEHAMVYYEYSFYFKWTHGKLPDNVVYVSRTKCHGSAEDVNARIRSQYMSMRSPSTFEHELVVHLCSLTTDEAADQAMKERALDLLQVEMLEYAKLQAKAKFYFEEVRS